MVPPVADNGKAAALHGSVMKVLLEGLACELWAVSLHIIVEVLTV